MGCCCWGLGVGIQGVLRVGCQVNTNAGGSNGVCKGRGAGTQGVIYFLGLRQDNEQSFVNLALWVGGVCVRPTPTRRHWSSLKLYFYFYF